MLAQNHRMKVTYNLTNNIEKIICELCNEEILLSCFAVHADMHEQELKSIPPPKLELPATVEGLMRQTFEGKGDEKECKICLVEYATNDKLIRLSCLHHFHEACILDWIIRSNSCPLCITPTLK